MAEPTLQQVFGANATQDANTITISKADLTSVGLTSSATNRAEQLFVAILLKAADYLNSTNQGTDNDIQVTIEDGFLSIVSRNNSNYRQNSYTVNLQKLDTSSTIDPDDY
ncbi:hypothetical protein ACE1AT_13885 [Pelatocladus sp. BLCC-F211]|uniref:hypothetical protein n=1 Tax=Pelatocladus sp. BLCC-F211 TaxID=3342752 RepID=UPI0035B826B8